MTVQGTQCFLNDREVDQMFFCLNFIGLDEPLPHLQTLSPGSRAQVVLAFLRWDGLLKIERTCLAIKSCPTPRSSMITVHNDKPASFLRLRMR